MAQPNERVQFQEVLEQRDRQDHPKFMLCIRPMLGFKRFKCTVTTIADIELMLRIRKGQFSLDQLHDQGQTAPVV